MTETRPVPPDLPVDPPSDSLRLVRMVVLGLVQASCLVLLAWLLDGLTIDGFWTAFAMIVVLSLLNALVWPFVIRVTLPLVIWTIGLFTFVLNAAFIVVAAAIVEGIEIASFWTALAIALVLTAVNIFVGGMLDVDNDHIWRSQVARRVLKRTDTTTHTDVPGFLFIQIDGLGHDVLSGAIQSGHAPFLARLVDGGTHRIVPWECDLSSQTGAMQAGILLGDNQNMPAFRWYEKDSGRIMVTNRPKDAADIEAQQSSGHGLLVGGGASRANVFTGDADDSMFTFSSLSGSSGGGRDRFLYVVSTPYTFFRVLILMVVDIVRERRAYRRARKSGVKPLGHRGGVYPLLRAGTTVALAEITWAVLVADIARGVPAAYADLVGYDEVAHHSGIKAPDALDTLKRTDDQLERLLTVVADAPRPYYVVILADHGQTQGETFKQRYDETLEAVVQRLANTDVTAPVLAEEGWNNLNGLLTDASDDPSTLGKAVKRATKNKTDEGEVALGPATERTVDVDDDIIVLASGNLGLVSFASIEGRASRQQIDAAFPGLIEGLRRHPGIGLILVRDEALGDIVLGPDGVHQLDGDVIEGSDPLTPFGPNTAHHLRRTSSFTNCPDLLVNSFYDPEADEGAAFEELIGFHGGLGGKQSHPFVLAPTNLTQPTEPLVGARSIYELFKTWLGETQGGNGWATADGNPSGPADVTAD
ncbi:MAG: phage holin family protein [Acidimicrobiales bacterium]